MQTNHIYSTTHSGASDPSKSSNKHAAQRAANYMPNTVTPEILIIDMGVS